MLEVGRLESYAADEAHFGLWVVTSSPLILGFDMLSDETMDRVWPIITNIEAIAINQACVPVVSRCILCDQRTLHLADVRHSLLMRVRWNHGVNQLVREPWAAVDEP
jgi:hypothetical protein|eukprot:COSAG02_NODE_1241_length_13704_cov_3.128188_2_plen_107_part_00